MPEKLTIKAQIIRANKIHNNCYTYNNYVYRNSVTPSYITCSKHGDFLMSFSNHLHTSKPQGCKYCTHLITKEKLINKANIAHNFKYDYSLIMDGVRSTDLIEVLCHEHGAFQINASKHYNEKKGCQKCSTLPVGRRKISIEKTLEDLKNFKYAYKLNHNFKDRLDNIEAYCKIHKEFAVSISHAIQGRGCPTCAIEYRKNNLTFSKTNFKKVCIKNNKGFGIFYILKCFNENEEFYKIGITSRSITERYKTKNSMPYTYEIIQEIQDTSDNIYDFETYMKRQLKVLRYKPLNSFYGSATECFKLTPS